MLIFDVLYLAIGIKTLENQQRFEVKKKKIEKEKATNAYY